MRRIAVLSLVAVLVLLVALQLVPYGRTWSNPAVSAEPAWDSPHTRMLAVNACFDCHSNQARRPWYGNIAPVSWLVQHDVDEGRQKLNFSEWNRPQDEAGDAAEAVQDGEMPPALYKLMHAESRLSAADREALIAGLTKTLGTKQERRNR